MGPVRRLFLRFIALFRSGRAERDRAREIEAHLRLLEDQFVANGMARAAHRPDDRAAGGMTSAGYGLFTVSFQHRPRA